MDKRKNKGKDMANKRPSCCLSCPIAQQREGKCGVMKKEIKNGRISQYKVPDERCLIGIIKNKQKRK